MDILSNLPHVLLIADDPVRRQELDFALRSWGHATTLVNTSAALAWLNQSPVDGRIVLVDGRLQAREAIACCRSIRDQTAPACVHYLLILAESDGQLLPEAFAVGATCLLMTEHEDTLLRARLLPLCQRSKRQMQQQYHLQALMQSHQLMKKDLQELGQVQKFWLPNPKKPIDGIDFAWVYRPAFIVSGDHFNVMQLSETQIGFCMIDVMGHGIAAAMRSLEMARSLSTHPNEGVLYEPAGPDGKPRRVRSPSEVANLLNVSFKMTEASPIYCTLIYGVLDTVSGKGSFAQAGHGGPVIITSAGVVSTLGHGGFPVGLIDEPSYEEVAFQMLPGDRLFLYSDGITESADASSRIYGEQRLLTYLAGVNGSVSEQLQAVDSDITRWVGAGPLDLQHDDLSMLMLAYKQPVSATDEVGIPAAPATAQVPVQVAGADTPGDGLLFADAGSNDPIRTLIVSASSDVFAGMLPIFAARGMVMDMLPIDDVQFDHVVLSQYQLILVSWSGDLTRQRALLECVAEVRQALPIYVIACSDCQDAGSCLDALSAGADDFLALPISLAELQCRTAAGRQWIARDRILREELRHQQAINEQITTDLKVIEAFQRSRFPEPGAIQGDIASGWLHSTTSYSPDQLGIIKLDDNHIAFFIMHSAVKSMLSLVAAWATSRLLSREIDGNLLYDVSASNDKSPRIRTPSEVIQEVHERFLGKPTAQFRCTVTYGVMNTATGRGQLVHVGANPPLLVRANADVDMIGQPCASLGDEELTLIMNHDFVLGKGDTLFLYGAGLQAVAEQVPAACTDLKQIFVACHAESTLQRSLTTLGRIVTKWRETGGDHGANADISVLVLQRSDMGSIMRTVLNKTALESAFLPQLPEMLGVSSLAAPRSGMKLSIPALDLDLAFEAGKVAGEFALNHGLSSIESYFVDVAVVEVATNVSRHGYVDSAGALDIWLVEQDGGIVVRLIDQGNAIDAAIIETARSYEFSDQFDDIDNVKEGGMGLPLIFKSMDAVHYESAKGRNSFFMFKRGEGHSKLIFER